MQQEFDEKVFASFIKRRLNELEMTQRELARKVGITEVTISRYLSALRKPKAEHVEKIMQVLDSEKDLSRLENVSYNKYMKDRFLTLLDELPEEDQNDILEVVSLLVMQKTKTIE